MNLKIGLIGLDTSHVIAFTEILNKEHKVVCGFPGAVPDFDLARLFLLVDRNRVVLQQKQTVRKKVIEGRREPRRNLCVTEPTENR